MTNEEALRILHCPSAYLTDEDSEFAHMIPLFSKAYGQAMAVAFEALKKADALDKIRAEIEKTAKDYDKFDDYRRVRGLWIALEIIDKHLTEVSNNDD